MWFLSWSLSRSPCAWKLSHLFFVCDLKFFTVFLAERFQVFAAAVPSCLLFWVFFSSSFIWFPRALAEGAPEGQRLGSFPSGKFSTLILVDRKAGVSAFPAETARFPPMDGGDFRSIPPPCPCLFVVIGRPMSSPSAAFCNVYCA